MDIVPIGYVKNEIRRRKDEAWGKEISDIIIDIDLQDGMHGLEDFSHAVIIYHLNQANFKKEDHLQRRPQNRKDMPKDGIFSQRAKNRPNQLGMTTVEICRITDNILTVKGLDAIDGTPILDIKPYYPQYDCKENVKVPSWVNTLMDNYF
ncbi:MAG: tRNA (N6-threonylcarbamoyladenosine(37)-N6)-methyltransferase TrmO [Coprobacillaceae bacterium]